MQKNVKLKKLIVNNWAKSIAGLWTSSHTIVYRFINKSMQTTGLIYETRKRSNIIFVSIFKQISFFTFLYVIYKLKIPVRSVRRFSSYTAREVRSVFDCTFQNKVNWGNLCCHTHNLTYMKYLLASLNLTNES